jgi:hypothetical protein
MNYTFKIKIIEDTINSDPSLVDTEAIKKIYRHDYSVELESISSIGFGEARTYGVNYGTMGNDFMMVNFKCQEEGGTLIDGRVLVIQYVLVSKKGMDLEDLVQADFNAWEIEYLMMNDDISEENKAWLKLR